MNPLWLLKIFGMVSGVNVKKAFAFIASYWKLFLIAVLAAVVGYQNFSDTRFLFWAQTIPALQAELEESRENLRTAGKANATLSLKIEKNNARVAEYKKLTGKLEQEIQDLSTVLVKEREQTTKDVAVILTDPTPKTCEKAIQYLRDGKKDLKW